MKEFKTALKEVLDGQTGAGNPLESVKKVSKSGNFAPVKNDFDLVYFEEPVDRHLSGKSSCRAIESRLNIYCAVMSELNNREAHEAELEILAWKVADVILDNPTLACTSYPDGFCVKVYTKIGEIQYMNGSSTKNQMPVEIAQIPLTVRYEIRN